MIVKSWSLGTVYNKQILPSHDTVTDAWYKHEIIKIGNQTREKSQVLSQALE